MRRHSLRHPPVVCSIRSLFLVFVSFVLLFVISFVKERHKYRLFTLSCTYVESPLACNSTLMRRHSLASVTGHLAQMPDPICWMEDSPKFHSNQKAFFEIHPQFVLFDPFSCFCFLFSFVCCIICQRKTKISLFTLSCTYVKSPLVNWVVI